MKRTTRRKYKPKRPKRSKNLGYVKPKKKFRLKLQYASLVGKWIFQIAVVCLLAYVSVWYFGQRVSMVGDSMNPVLKNGDIVFVNRIVYNATTPKRGDVIVFKPRGNENSHYYIKRIIGLPGETIEFIENRIYIDGERLDEEYETTNIDYVGVVEDKLTLGNDEYFVLGDNRENSEDSRYADIGNVKREYIYGKAWLIVSPKEHFGLVK